MGIHEDWRLRDRCRKCFHIVTLTGADIIHDDGKLSWKCPACASENAWHAAALERIPHYIKKAVAEGHFLPPPPKLPWYKRWFRRKRPSDSSGTASGSSES